MRLVPQRTVLRTASRASGFVRLLLGLCVAVGAGALPASAQVGEDVWALPANLSQSGAASSIATVPQPDGGLRVVWWDQFDGPTMAEGEPGTWAEPIAVPILVETPIERPAAGGPQTELVAVAEMPAIFGDETGRAHAFWLGEPDEETGATSLLHSRLESADTTWTIAQTLAESAVGLDLAVDGTGGLHLVYVRTLSTTAAPAGLYYRSSTDGGVSWTQPVQVHTSRYYRLLSPEQTYLDIATAGSNLIAVTWNDPQAQTARVAQSRDGGAAWLEPVSLTALSNTAQSARLMVVPDGRAFDVQVLWQDTSLGVSCTINQAGLADLYDEEETEPLAVSEGLGCPDPSSIAFYQVGEGQVLMVAATTQGSLALTVWNGEAWSEVRTLPAYFAQPERDAILYLRNLQPLLLSEAGAGQPTLVVVGTDEAGDVWAAVAQVDVLDVVYAEPSPWSDPESLSAGPTLPDLPAAVTDDEGRLHLLWSEAEAAGGIMALRYARRENDRWTRPTTVLRSPDGGATAPSFAVQGEYLHALWRGGARGQVWYSRAFVQDAYAESGWQEPGLLPELCGLSEILAGGNPHLVSLGGRLHAVFAVPVNEGRGIYYTSSSDDGDTWSAAVQIFDAVAAGWAAVDNPRLAVDYSGMLHAIWEHPALAATEPAQGVYYAQSGDAGKTWSEPATVAEGDFGLSRVTVSRPGEVHLLWQDMSGVGTWWHRWAMDESEGSGDQGEWVGWTRPSQVVGLGRVPGPLGLAADGGGRLHLVGWRDLDGTQAELVHATWTGERWEQQEALVLDFVPGGAGAAAALWPEVGWLGAVLRSATPAGDAEEETGLWYTGREVPAVEAQPTVVMTPQPTPTPTPTPLPGPVATPTPVLADGPPPSGGGLSGLPLALLYGAGLAAFIVFSVSGVRLLRGLRR